MAKSARVNKATSKDFANIYQKAGKTPNLTKMQTQSAAGAKTKARQKTTTSSGSNSKGQSYKQGDRMSPETWTGRRYNKRMATIEKNSSMGQGVKSAGIAVGSGMSAQAAEDTSSNYFASEADKYTAKQQSKSDEAYYAAQVKAAEANADAIKHQATAYADAYKHGTTYNKNVNLTYTDLTKSGQTKTTNPATDDKSSEYEGYDV